MLLKGAVIEKKISLSKMMLVFFPLNMTLEIAKQQGHNICSHYPPASLQEIWQYNQF